MTAPFSFAAFQAQQAQDPPVGPRRSPLSFASFQAQQEEEEDRIRAERGARDGVLPAVVTTAQAPKPFERALARGVMASGTTDPAFGRESDLTPLARPSLTMTSATSKSVSISTPRFFASRAIASVIAPMPPMAWPHTPFLPFASPKA